MNDILRYMVCWQLKKRQIFLLWCNGGKNRDSFILRQHEPMKLLFTETIEEMMAYTKQNGLLLSDEPMQRIDFCTLKITISGLRINRPVSERSCKLILEAWNTLDDISNTTNKSIAYNRFFPKESTDRLYEKIFYGNNLDPVTPPRSGYSPLLIQKEIKMIKLFFKEAVKELSFFIGYELW